MMLFRVDPQPGSQSHRSLPCRRITFFIHEPIVLTGPRVSEKYFSLFSEKIYAEKKNIFLFMFSSTIGSHLIASQKFS